MTFSECAIEAAANKLVRFAPMYRKQDGTAGKSAMIVAKDMLTAALAVDGLALQGWRTIDSAPKDRTPILAKFFDDIYPQIRPNRDDLERWNGLQVVLRHPGLADNGFDIGWSVAAPVGNGGFPDEWIEGWMPLPLTAASDGEVG